MTTYTHILDLAKEAEPPADGILSRAIFQDDKKFVFYCAGGLRSALAAKTAQDMGLKPVAHIEGGFAAWRDAGGPIDPDRRPAGNLFAARALARRRDHA